MEKKFISHFEIKADETDETGNTIVGYGSVFGNVDRGGDVVVEGAFSKSLTSGRTPKMLWQHRPDEVIGVWNVVSEDEKGLKVEGKFANTPRGNEIKELVRLGAINGLSIGYRTVDAQYNSQGHYLIKEAELWEISCVTFPMNEEATIDAIKAAEMSKREVEGKLRDAGFSKSVAQALISGGYEALSAKRDVSTNQEHQDILAQLKSIFSN